MDGGVLEGHSAQDRARASSTVCCVWFTVRAEGTHLEEIREICVRPAERCDVSRPRHTTTVGSVDGLMRCFNFIVLCAGLWILDQRQRSAGDSGPSATRWLCTFRRAPPLRGGRRHCPYSTDRIRMVATSASHVGVPITMWTTGRRRRMLDGRRRTPTNHAHERRACARARSEDASGRRTARRVMRRPVVHRTPTRPQPPRPVPRRAVLFMLVTGVRQ